MIVWWCLFLPSQVECEVRLRLNRRKVILNKLLFSQVDFTSWDVLIYYRHDPLVLFLCDIPQRRIFCGILFRATTCFAPWKDLVRLTKGALFFYLHSNHFVS